MEGGLLNEKIKEYKQLLENTLRSSVQNLDAPSSLKEAMAYSLEAGGKRIRPMLVFAAMDAFGKNPAHGVTTAAAIEMVHTYSLIHDDLPSMDNDDLRRGKPTNHKVFGEAMAILAGDALLTHSFELIGTIPDEHAGADKKIKLVTGLAKAAGASGMVGGQAADMEGEDKELTLAELESIHLNKTGRLLEFSVLAGSILSGADQEKLTILSRFAYHLGLAFQIRDDILDVEGDELALGKRVGSDTANHKSTYPRLLTLEGAKQALDHHITMAREQLGLTGLNTSFLLEITEMVATRNS
ncbi:polyprenyl synthetase family protein [Neobacillus notoginsengisoli]|uniref:Farnesyl diphosphate synthase n=1 Tax=Neobacillus notoginsengisoli TaxID=1578198 RepID=A0A417YUZ7_9BACI|nr:farnesyl diphosphate synthase [Neobacillus notoginsengisoli]RHW41123.1 polyprenyl synthetase family protein [Neobacillus notoginsengisoli]